MKNKHIYEAPRIAVITIEYDAIVMSGELQIDDIFDIKGFGDYGWE